MAVLLGLWARRRVTDPKVGSQRGPVFHRSRQDPGSDPHHNEVENLARIVTRVRASVPEAHVLVADDNSPDGTARVADELAATDDHVQVMHRLGKEGLGAAYLAGFSWALDNGYDVVVEMDADGSHQPEQLPLLLDALRNADLVLGSRWVPGGSVVNWPKSREILSKGATGTPVGPYGSRCRMRPAATAPSALRPCGRSTSTESAVPGTSSRSISPTGPSRRVCAWSRCRSNSSNGKSATAR